MMKDGGEKFVLKESTGCRPKLKSFSDCVFATFATPGCLSGGTG